MNLPEGLHLALTPEQTLAIFDAQDVMWIEFYDGGTGDPSDWPKNIIKATCSRLGVKVGIDEMGEELDIEGFLHWYFGELDFLY